ncbi:MAG: M20/M25/M40 family metallo-hydrolase [Ferruginibacter sp.]|nr:M20/M25/M40 family metallo-hydrolase [Ferruginibacter sp.]
MKKLLLILGTGLLSLFSFGQNIDKIINAKEVERIETVLSADDMMGRKPFTLGIDKAASFIADEFTRSKLSYWDKATNYFQEFSLVKPKLSSLNGVIDGDTITETNFFAHSSQASVQISNTKGYEMLSIKKDDDFFNTVGDIIDEGKNCFVLVDKVHSDKFKRLKNFGYRQKFYSPTNQIFYLTNNTTITNININADYKITEQKLKNVVGVIPGKSKKDEYVVFGGHYDHLGVTKPNKTGDSIYNGANDDAAGTTAVMMLAKYFSTQKNNERTLIFVAFTAEEIGGYGSQYFSKQLNPDKVVAMFNIEMIGTESKWGKNSAFITGYEKSDMGKILQANLNGSKFKFEPDPYPKQNLFYRSDNATLAALGVPAHTISTSKMEEPPNNEPNYHKVSDEIGTLDMNNMAEIIKAIAVSSKTIVSGRDTPSRVEKMK